MSHRAAILIKRTIDGSSPVRKKAELLRIMFQVSFAHDYDTKLSYMSPYHRYVGVRQRVSVAVRAEVEEGDGQSPQAETKGHSWRVLGHVISKVSHRMPETHHGTPALWQTANDRLAPQNLEVELLDRRY